MTRTNIDLDDDAVAEVMARYHLQSKREAVNFALNQLRRTQLTVEETLALEGIGWDGDLDAMRDQPVATIEVSPQRQAELDKLLKR